MSGVHKPWMVGLVAGLRACTQPPDGAPGEGRERRGGPPANSRLNALGWVALMIVVAYAHPTGARSTAPMQPAAAAVAAGASIELHLVAPLREALEAQVVGFIDAQRALHGLPPLDSVRP